MADVARKIISGNDIHNGAATLAPLVEVATPYKLPDVYLTIDVTALETQYTNRFDDVNYYTHSGV